MSQVFISYSSTDRDRARRLAEAVEAAGYSVWWDRQIVPGEMFDEAIETALDQSACVVVIWSSASVKSEWVKTEAAEAAKRKVLVPVLLDSVTIPLEFRRIQAADLTHWNGSNDDSEFQKFLAAIQMETRSASQGSGSRGTPVETAGAITAAAHPVADQSRSFQRVMEKPREVSVGVHESEPRPPIERRGQGSSKWVLILLAVVVVAGLLFWGRRPGRVETPNVIGMSYDKAAAVIADLNLVPERQDRRSAKEPADTIISQTPPAGTMRVKKSRVVLTVAVPLGPASLVGSNHSSPKGEAASTENDGKQRPPATEESNNPPVTETKNNPPAEATSKFGVAIVFDPPSNIREAPNDRSDILCSVRQKVTINILAAVGTWYTTDVCPGKIGYIHRSQLKFSE
jgi:TIR domain-containing protein/PASTA domain-containing protein